MTTMKLILVCVVVMSTCQALRPFEFNQLKQAAAITGTSSTDENGLKWYTLTTTSVPDHDTADFPTRYNPNEVGSHNLVFTVRRSPEFDFIGDGTCLNQGPIGLTISGAVFFSPSTNQPDGDAMEDERFDDCDGHPNGGDIYHYHGKMSCIVDLNVNDQFIGVAWDGVPVYGPIDENGNVLTSADLDRCHGRNETYTRGSNTYTDYRYRITNEYPYILGCYRATPNKNTNGQNCKFHVSPDHM